MSSLNIILIAFFSILAPMTWAIDYTAISENIRLLTKDGELKKAYDLSAEHQSKSDLIAMQYAQIALLVGEEEKGRNIFKRLTTSSTLNDTQKNNMHRFVSQFDLSLKKRLRKADQYADRGQCAEANLLYRNLLNYKSTKPYAQKSMHHCEEPSLLDSMAININGRAYYKLGYDSNVNLDNEDLLSKNEHVESDQYQKLYAAVKNDVNTKAPFWVQGAVSAYHLDYISGDTQDFDQLSVRAGMTLGGRADLSKLEEHQFFWRVPVSYRRVSLNDEAYTDYVGIKGRVEHRIFRFHHFIETGIQDKSYLQSDDTGRDGEVRDIAYAWRYKWANNRLFGRMQVRGFSGPLDESDAYTQSSIQIGWNRRLPSYSNLLGFKPSLQLSYIGSETRYDGIDQGLVDAYGAAYDKVRSDSKHRISAELKFVRSEWQVMGAFNHQQRDSNLAIYTYNRNTTELGVQYRF